jgi:hypothetical protein
MAQADLSILDEYIITYVHGWEQFIAQAYQYTQNNKFIT